jgi:hypothetical protein
LVKSEEKQEDKFGDFSSENGSLDSKTTFKLDDEGTISASSKKSPVHSHKHSKMGRMNSSLMLK